MKVYRLRIEQEMARIAVESQMAALAIKKQQRTMHIEQQRAIMSIEREAAYMKLDLQGFYDNIGLKGPQTLNRDTAANARADANQAISQIMSDARFVGTLPATSNGIGQLARQKLLAPYQPEPGGMPPGAMEMQGNPGRIQIDWSNYELNIIWDQYQAPKIRLEPKASVEVRLAQEPRIEYRMVEEMIPPRSGRNIDAAI